MCPRPLTPDPAYDDLRGRLSGPLLRPADAGYDEARGTWNGRFDPRPAAIAQCTGTADVVAAVDFARERGARVSVKSTGHSYAGHSVCDGGLVIDLSLMDAVTVDPAAKTVRVGPGARWGAVDAATQAVGLATTGATVSTVGVAGYALGGGTGYLAREHGLALDNLRSLEVVTAAGQLLRASERENPDLFWALRGGGGNFGVVTALELALHDLGPELLAGQIVYPLGQARDVLRRWRDAMTSAPDELQCYAFVLNLPPLDVFPESYHGRPALDLVVAYAGPVAEGDRAVQPFREAGRPLLDAVAPLPYAALQQAFDAGMPRGLRWHSKAHYFDRVSDDLIDVVLEHTASLPGPHTLVYFEPGGGAVGRVDAGATAFPHRDAAAALHIFPGWSDPSEDDALIGWARSFSDAVAPFATVGVYVNLLSEDEAGRVPAAYGANYDRLAELKRRYDPDNLFRSNHNVAPAETSRG